MIRPIWAALCIFAEANGFVIAVYLVHAVEQTTGIATCLTIFNTSAEVLLVNQVG